jgi:hypothetical protein
MAAAPHIEFSCDDCGHRFVLPFDLAGASVRCPECGQLQDAPEPGDATLVADDGALLLAPEVEPAVKVDRVAEVAHYFGHARAAGRVLGSFDLADVDPPAAPRATVAPLALDERPELEPPAQDVPLAKRAMQYARPDLSQRLRIGPIALALFRPLNLMVVGCALLMHAVAVVMAIAIFGIMPAAVPAAFALAIAIFAHYTNTIEAIATDGADELPAAIRGIALVEDLWQPFKRLAAALLFCYAVPYVILAHSGLPAEFAWLIGIPLLLAGTAFFPAVYLTIATAGAANNLRPDRLVGVMRVGGRHYAWSVALWAATFACYAMVFWTSRMMILDRFFSVGGGLSTSLAILSHPLTVGTLLMAAVGAAHVFCWHLSLFYRGWHDRFPWVLQFHVSTRPQRRIVRRKPRYVTPAGPAQNPENHG